MHLKNYIPLLLIISIVSCTVFTEEDIENSNVKLLVPADSVSSEIQTLNFMWDWIEGASAYNLQIVSPDFMNAENLLLDTIISRNSFEFTLYPGLFQWRVNALNSGYSSGWTVQTLEITVPIDITKQKIVLVSPSDQHNTNSENITFKWNTLMGSDKYSLIVRTPDWDGDDFGNYTDLIEDNLEITMDEGIYEWGVMGHDTIENETSLPSIRTLIVDFTPPGKPTLSSPSNDSNLTSLSVDFSWIRNDDNGVSRILDEIQIFLTDTNRAPLVDQTIGETTFSHTFETAGTYVWRVKSVDAAGNNSEYSNLYSLTVTDEE